MNVDLTEKELAYISRAIFARRIDHPEDAAHLTPTLDTKISVARMRAAKEEKEEIKKASGE